MKRKHIFLTLPSSGLLLCFGYVLARYVLFDLHGMKQWPMTMLTLGAIVVCMFFRSKLVPLIAAAGYTVSFLIGALLQTNFIGPGGTSSNNLWVIWTGSYLLLIALGIVLDIIHRRRTKQT